MSKTVIISLLAGVLSGCLSVERAPVPGEGAGTQVLVRNYGKFLLNCVPMGCGNANENPKCDFVMFRNDVTMEKVQRRFLAECGKVGGEVTDVSYFSRDDVFLRIPFMGIELPIPYLWTHREIQISGVVK